MSQPEKKFSRLRGWFAVGLVVVTLAGLAEWLAFLEYAYSSSRIGPGKINPVWSPDGTHIAYCYVSSLGCYVIDVDGSNPVFLTNSIGTDCNRSFLKRCAENLAWSPDGLKLTFCVNGECYVVDADGRNPLNLTNTPDIDEAQSVWSPDGSRIAFISSPEGGAQIFLVNPDGSNLAPLTTGDGSYFYYQLAWSPDGSRISLGGKPGKVIDASNGEQLGSAGLEAVPIWWDWSPDGTYIITTTGFGPLRFETLYLTDAGGNDLTVLTDAYDIHDTAWSPDGTQIAFTDEEEGVYLINADGSGLKQFTSIVARNPSSFLSWSPDGKHIAFIGNGPGDSDYNQIFVIDSDGGNVLQLTKLNQVVDDFAWSPDGTRIAFTSYSHSKGEIFMMDADGQNLVKLTGRSIWDWLVQWE